MGEIDEVLVSAKINFTLNPKMQQIDELPFEISEMVPVSGILEAPSLKYFSLVDFNKMSKLKISPNHTFPKIDPCSSRRLTKYRNDLTENNFQKKPHTVSHKRTKFF